MNKSRLVIFLIVVIVFVLALFYSGYLGNFFQSKDIPKGEVQVKWMAGVVKRVNKNSIFIEGKIKDKLEIIEFVVSSSTIIKKSEIKLTEEQIKIGGRQTPKTTITIGVISDITSGADIIQVKTHDNLLKTKKVVAYEINYLVYDFPN